MVEKNKFILGIALGLTFLILTIIAFIVLYVLVKKRMKIKAKLNAENSEVLNSILKTHAKNFDFIFFSKSMLNYGKNKYIYLKGPILVSKEALILTHPLFLEGNVDGNCIEREWYRKNENSKKEIYFPNPIIDDDNIVKQMISILPKDVPIIVLYIMLNKTDTYDIYNNPGHVLFAKESELENTFKIIKEELKDSLNDNQLKVVIEKLNSFSNK